MNSIVRYTALLALAAATPSLFAEISVPTPAVAAAQGNCDLLASNTVRATFVGLHDLTAQTINDDTPTTVQVAVFEVIELVGYKKFNRFGDGQLTAGTKFTISMSRELPGQPASIADTIAQMQPGEEAVMRVDHLYLMNGRQGEPLRVCSRMARRAAQPAVTTEQPEAPAAPGAPSVSNNTPLPTVAAPAPADSATAVSGGSFNASSTSVSITFDNGKLVKTRTESKYDPATGQMKTRMFINDTEVDPQTKKPLKNEAKPAPAPAPAPAAAPAAAPADANGDDTVVEHADTPAPTAPAPAPAPAPEEGEGF